jgi:5-methylcytosine-specific restriction endonuclease McrA
MNTYPDNWGATAATIKQAAGYRCQRCGLKCLPPGNSYRHLPKSIRAKLAAQVHHIDWNPANNNRSNLICLCPGCHLRSHRHAIRPIEGQLALKLELPKQKKRSIRYSPNFQLTLADLIDRLPKLKIDYQLKLDFN